MPHSLPSKNCIHPEDMVYTFGDGLGNFKTQCGLCMLGGEWCKNPIVARVSFLEKTTNQKEITVNTSEYRRGVEDATAYITYEDVVTATRSSPEAAVNVYNRIADARRKSLLTKKVTKYFFLYKPGDRVSNLYDTEELAYKASLNNYGQVA